jgi:hypothetical protein
MLFCCFFNVWDLRFSHQVDENSTLQEYYTLLNGKQQPFTLFDKASYLVNTQPIFPIKKQAKK